MAFFFLAYLFSFWRYSAFCNMQMRKMMTSEVVPAKQHDIQSGITLEIFKHCPSNLAPAMYISKETE